MLVLGVSPPCFLVPPFLLLQLSEGVLPVSGSFPVFSGAPSL